jgi:hypothetical protein
MAQLPAPALSSQIDLGQAKKGKNGKGEEEPERIGTNAPF